MTQAMIDLHTELRDRYADIFRDHEASLNGHKTHPLQEIRRKAMEKLDQTPFPGRKSEDWKYTAVPQVLKTDYRYPEIPANFDLPETLDNPVKLDQRIQLVFVNGHLDRERSSLGNLEDGLTIATLEEAIENPDWSAYIEHTLTGRIDQPGNAFELLNLAFSRQGLFIHISRNTRVTTPIEVTYCQTQDQHAFFTHPQILVKADQSAHLKIIERYEHVHAGQEALSNAWHHFDIHENARLDFAKFQRESAHTNHIHQTCTSQGRNSRFDAYVLDVGGNIVRNTHATYLGGENTETHLMGNYVSTGKQSIDNQTFIDHAIPNCFSNELYKGIAAERGKGVFNGKILVRKDAQKTNAFQQNANMVLSPHATVNAKPQLEIFADDVKCSHGATIGQLDEKAVFYLRSRGIPDLEARRMLQKAFVDEVVDHVDFKEIHGFAHEIINHKLSSISV